MTIKITNKKSGGLISSVEKMSGVDFSRCYQCKKCSAGCPVANKVSSPPSEIIRQLQLGAGEEMLQADIVWTCLSCDTCYARCPNEINFAAAVDALRALALEKGLTKVKDDIPQFNRRFLDTVRDYGRSYDLKMIALYKLGSRKISADMDKFPTMLKKGKMAVLPPSGADKATTKRIFKGVGEKGGGGK